MLNKGVLFLILNLILLISFEADAQPTSGFTYTFTNAGCHPDSVVFTNTSTGANAYKWDFGDFSSPVNAVDTSHLYFWDGTFIVKLTAYDTLTGDSSVSIQVLNISLTPYPGWAWFLTDPASPICPGASVDFNTAIFPQPYFMLWDFDDGDSSLLFNPKHTYIDTGTYAVTLIAGNTCGSDTFVSDVIIDANTSPFANFTLPDSVCPNTSVLFNNTSFPTSVSSFWNFGDGNTSSLFNPIHSYALTGSYDVILIVNNECKSDTITKTIIVDSSLVPSVSVAGSPILVCPGDTVGFVATGGYLTGYFWDFDDGNTSLQDNPNHAFTDTGTYNIILTGTNSCGNNRSDSVAIIVDNAVPPTAVNFWWFPFNACPGSVISFNNTSSETGSVFWDFDDGNTSTEIDPAHIFADTGIYNVKLLVSSSCGGEDSIVQLINIKNDAVPFAGFSYEPSVLFCTGDTVKFTNWSSDTSDVFWDFGDGDTSSQVNPVHVFTNTGSYNVLLKITNDCNISDYYVETITIIFAINLTYVLDTVTSGNSDGAIDLSITGGTMPYTYLWSIGATTEDISNLFANIYTVVVTDANGCPASAIIEVPAITGIPVEVLHATSLLHLYPNPAKGSITFDIRLADINDAEIRIFDVLGKLLYNVPLNDFKKMNSQQNDYTYRLDLTGLSNGMYYVQLKSSENVINKKIIIAK